MPYTNYTSKEKIAMPYTNYTSKEVASRGEVIYKREIRDKVEPKHKGKFLVIDIETGEYKMNADDLVATKRLLAKRPDAAIYGLQIGSSTAYRIGASAMITEKLRTTKNERT